MRWWGSYLLVPGHLLFCVSIGSCRGRVSSGYCPHHLVILYPPSKDNSFATASLKLELGEKPTVCLFIYLFTSNSVLEIQVRFLDTNYNNIKSKEREESKGKEKCKSMKIKDARGSGTRFRKLKAERLCLHQCLVSWNLSVSWESGN